MEAAAVERTDSQRLQTNGPRVSFNRDVHVKRIGARPNETTNYKIETTNLQPPSTQHLRRELPADLSEESIRKEAALILAQAERIKCKAEGANNIPAQIQKSKRSIPNKFHSLPSRKKKPVEKVVSRSVSDASSKKSKKPSIFSIFSRKSDSNLSQDQKHSRFAESGGRRLVRSKSDVGSYKEPRAPKKRNSEKEDPPTGTGGNNKQQLLPTQLSPIIENAQKEDYFEELFNRERRKSEAITAHEKNATDLKDFLDKYNGEQKLSGNIGYTHHKDLDLVPSKPIAETILALQEIKSKSLEDMHSSQLPPEKPALTKGLTVNGMVQRLSMERFSPPPTISGPAFSYTRPNEQIIYAQLAAEEERPYKRSPLNGTLNRNSVDINDYPSSHHTSKITIEAPPLSRSPVRDSFSPVAGPTMIRIQHSRSPWQQLSPRNLSDEDEGLGVEMRKSYEDDPPQRYYDRSKSPAELPIIPVIRSVTPPNRLQHEPPFDDINTLSRRRAVLESRIRTRRFATPEAVTIEYHASPERNRVREEFHDTHRRQYLTPEREEYNRFHKPRSEEIIHKYSPERTHLDMVAPSKTVNGQQTSKYIHTKYYDDGTGGVKEVYERETKLDGHGKPYVRESRRRERMESPGRSIENVINAHDYEPNSLDSQYPYSTDQENQKPVNVVRHTSSLETEHWQDSLKRDKRQQRSFDKGDSGIENDFRKESFNGHVRTKWRKRTFRDDVAACELFIKKERRHTEEQHPQRKRYDFVYRERSIDDGSHYDPRLDKYPKTSTSTLRRSGKENASPSASQSHMEDTLKRNKKVGGFQMVKQLFSGNRKKEQDSGIMVNGKSESSMHDGVKDKYMVKEEEMRSRYREHRGRHHNDLKESKAAPDISMRRRLSTPKSSPLLKRTSSEATRKHSPLTSKTSAEAKSEKTSWFKSIDRRSKSKSKEKLDSAQGGENDSNHHTLKRNTYRTPPQAPPIPPKNFRFFGDTDLDSNPPTVSRVTSTPRSRPSVSSLNRKHNYSQSAYHLDRITPTPQSAASSRVRSNSLQNLEEDGVDEIDSRKRRHYSRSRNLDDISESGSETEDQYKRQPLASTNRSLSKDKLDRSHRHEDRKSSERHLTASTSTLKRSPPQTISVDSYKQTAVKAPPKPARSGDRRFHSRDPDRLPDSSGTEGESSMQSQRSVVYLHATTVGAIPQPYQSSSRRRAASREDLRKNKLQPMTRTVSRSVSMLAPWKPKHLSEGYEINYSQEQNGKEKKLQTLPRKSTSTQHTTQTSTSTLSRSKKIEAPPSRSRRATSSSKSKDDLSSIRNSSTMSAPKSNFSSTLDSRKETLRRK